MNKELEFNTYPEKDVIKEKEILLKDVGINIKIAYNREDKVLKLETYLRQQIRKLENKALKYTFSTYDKINLEILKKLLKKLNNYDEMTLKHQTNFDNIDNMKK